uniref:Uncharacterized protein n=1 Tax=Lepeophtheirus salmonis TaxID=72036 RepID=A0A0K2SZI3_LEPSM
MPLVRVITLMQVKFRGSNLLLGRLLTKMLY